MSQNKSLEKRIKELADEESRLKQQIVSDSDQLKGRATQVGKILLVSGVVAIGAYWVFRGFFQEDEKVDGSQPDKKNKRRGSFSSRMAALASPYINKWVTDTFKQEVEDLQRDENPKKAN